MPVRQSRWRAEHAACQQAVNGVRDDLTAEIERLKAQNAKVRTAVSLLNSMVLSDEDHSETSRAVVRDALG